MNIAIKQMKLTAKVNYENIYGKGSAAIIRPSYSIGSKKAMIRQLIYHRPAYRQLAWMAKACLAAFHIVFAIYVYIYLFLHVLWKILFFFHQPTY